MFVIVTVTSSVSVSPLLSVTVILNTYVPATSPFTFVCPRVGLEKEYEEGPLTFVHLNDVIQPLGSVDVVAFRNGKYFHEIGIDWSAPALATGAVALVVGEVGVVVPPVPVITTVTSSELVAPLLSVTVTLKT